MLTRIIQFVIGAALGGAGGYLLWSNRSLAPTLFPPTASGVPWLLVLGLLVVMAGAVFLVYAVHPRPERKARLAAEAARREETLSAADSYYGERSRAADRDWRSRDLPPPAPARTPAAPEPARQPVLQPVPSPPPPAPTPVKPVATSEPPQRTPFPSQATLTPIPKAAEPPPAPTPPAPPPAPPPPRPAPMVVPAAAPAAPIALVTPITPPPKPPEQKSPGQTSFDKIRFAIREGRLDEADKLLTAEREKAQGVALAELTGLAGDQANAAGRQSNAKWLWRLALKRFGEANAMDTPAARAVAESLRLADV